MELWDAYNEKEEKLGFDLVRGDPIPEGVYHIVCDILVQHTDGRILLMRRDLRKEGYPGFYEASAGGSALRGETAEMCARRELLEETGIECDSMEEFARSVFPRGNTLYHEFYARTSCDPDSIRLQEGETIGFLWADRETFFQMLHDGSIIPTTYDRMKIVIDKL